MTSLARSIRSWLVSVVAFVSLGSPVAPADAQSAAAPPTKAAPAKVSSAPGAVRLYALDCGSIEFKDLRSFSDTGEYDGESGTVAVSCFLIRHSKGTLIWDTGIDPKFVQGSASGARGIRATMRST